MFSYRFDQSPWNGKLELIATVAPVYSTHFSEVCLNGSSTDACRKLLTIWPDRICI